jgi:hypothetical protein
MDFIGFFLACGIYSTIYALALAWLYEHFAAKWSEEMTDDYENDFYETLYDSEGRVRKVLKEQIEPENNSYFTTYNSSHGHCGLCGRIDCNGSCFK